MCSDVVSCTGMLCILRCCEFYWSVTCAKMRVPLESYVCRRSWNVWIPSDSYTLQANFIKVLQFCLIIFLCYYY